METAIAAEPIPFGSPVRLTDKGLRSCRPSDMDGIAKRPWVKGDSDSHYGKGQSVVYQIAGECLALIDNQAVWIDIRGGKIVEEV